MKEGGKEVEGNTEQQVDDLSSDVVLDHFLNSTAPLLGSGSVALTLLEPGSFSFVRGDSVCCTEKSGCE